MIKCINLIKQLVVMSKVIGIVVLFIGSIFIVNMVLVSLVLLLLLKNEVNQVIFVMWVDLVYFMEVVKQGIEGFVVL